MLGNWSLGDYGKKDAITMALDLLLNGLALDPRQLWVTVFSGDPELCLLPDETALDSWLRLGVPRERIVMLGLEDNFWTMGEGPGPCGPCTEIFVDRGPVFSCGSPDCRPGCSCERFWEVWNLVFMEYERAGDGKLTPLPQRNIDTGMGLERMAAVLQQVSSVLAIDLFVPAITRLAELSPANGIGTQENHAREIILDHTRAALFACLAGVGPGRDGRNSVV